MKRLIITSIEARVRERGATIYLLRATNYIVSVFLEDALATCTGSVNFFCQRNFTSSNSFEGKNQKTEENFE